MAQKTDPSVKTVFKDCGFSGANADVIKCNLEGQKVKFQGQIL